tara:strand:+ start:668 stop:3211 length:2544 start_codon:yes stop_codon:yes gene_type:complete
MSSSFQSTAFQSAARPVDTFVAEPSVLPKTDAEELATVLQTVNPNLQKYIGTRLEKTVEEEKDKAFKMALDTVLADGTIGKVADATRKQDGDEAARQLIGGNIFIDRFYKQYIGELYGSQLDSNAKEAYRDAEIDTFNAQGEPIKRSIRSFAPTDPEFIDWRQNYFKDQTQKILDLGGEIDSANFITNLQTSVVNLNKLARKENNEYKVEKVKDLSNDYFNKTAKDWLSGNREDARLHITNFINDTRKLGLTGGDAREVYTGLVENIANIGQYYVTTADVNDLDEVDDLIIGIGLSIPYGNNGGNLTQHPEWQEKIEPILENLEDELNEELTQGPKIDKARRRIKLENKLVEVNKLPIDTEEQRAIYKQKIIELKNDRQFSDLNEVFKTNNYPYIEDFSAEIFNIRTNMRLRNYEDNESPLDQLGLIKNKIVDLGITDDGILTDLNQAVQIAEQYKSIYQIFDVKSKPLFDDIDAFYRSQAGSKGVFGNINLTGGVSVNLGGLDNDLYIEKYKNEQQIDNNFETWIKENYYQMKDGKKVGGPSEADIKKWLTDERERVEKEVFKFKTESQKIIDEISNRPVNQRRGFGFGNEDDDFRESVLQLETPAFGNKKFEVEPGAFSEGGVTTVDVSSGDTLSGFANDLDTSVEAIKKANGMTSDAIQIGDVLVIPEGITDPNKVDAPKFDMNKLITSKDHPFNPVREKHNFQVIYNIAKEIGIKYPELVAAQAMEETGFGKNQSAKNNFLGLQATPSEVARGESERKMTTEFRGQGRQPEEADFKTFENIKAMMMQYKKQWNDNFLSRKGIVNANSIQEAIKMLQAEDYATNPDYDKNVLRIIDRAIKEGWF